MKNKVGYLGKTRAYRRYSLHHWRTEHLLNAGIVGLEESRKPLESVLKKFGDAKAPRGRIPKDYEPSVSRVESNDESITLSMDVRAAALMKKALSKNVEEIRSLNSHYFAIVAVSIWGAYETYVYMLFSELFERQPALLKTKETISYCDALDNKSNIEAYLSAQTLEKIGHFNLKDSLAFLDEKINFRFTKERQSNLTGIYLLRNIIAHNSGILRKGQETLLPQGVTVKNDELTISKSYLKRIHSVVKASVTILEKHVEKKFFNK